jgi:hypothetical protein
LRPEVDPDVNMTGVDVAATGVAETDVAATGVADVSVEDVVATEAAASTGVLNVKASGVIGRHDGSASSMGVGGLGEAKSKQISGESLRFLVPFPSKDLVPGVRSKVGKDAIDRPTASVN